MLQLLQIAKIFCILHCKKQIPQDGHTMKPNVLIVEDSHSIALLYREYLRNEAIQLTLVETGNEALDSIKNNPPHVMLLDLQLPDMDGMAILKYVTDQRLATSVLVVTGHGSVNVAVDAMRNGAFDFVEKPFAPERLLITLRNALERQRLSALVESYKEGFRDNYHEFIGSSIVMRGIYHIIESAAPSKATVFITGESGTGKELCAEAIHKESDRKNNAFVAINCAAIPRDLMESEIFGHVKGAFTGAHLTRQGAAATANGGTLFLDEICDMDMDLQTKFLRFIQTGSYQPVGSSELKKADIRFICATNKDPLKEVAAGRFREDLYYRLHVIPITLPALRKRDADVMMIARKFLLEYCEEEGKHFKDFMPETEAMFLAYNWPGNVRQLQNVMRNIVVLNDGDLVSPEMLPPPLNHFHPQINHLNEGIPMKPSISSITSSQKHSSILPDSVEKIRPLIDIEREIIERAIDLCNGNIPKAAIHLGISASTIYRKKQNWDAATTN